MNDKPKKALFTPKEYADFVVNLVNAETVLDAYRVLFASIYKLFIPHDHEWHDSYLRTVDDIKKQYDDFLCEFNVTERKIVALKMREAEALLVLNEADDLIQNNIIQRTNRDNDEENKEIKRTYLRFEDFDEVRKSLVFALMPGDWPEGVSKPDPQYLDSLKTIIHTSEHRLNPLYRIEYKTLINVHMELEKLKIANDRLKYIFTKSMDQLNDFIDVNCDMAISRGLLRHFLEELTLSKELWESTLIHTILQFYNQSRHDYYLDDEDDTIKMQSPFEMEEFSEWVDGYGRDTFYGSWADRAQSIWFNGSRLRYMFEWDSLIFRVCCFSVLQFINNKADRKRLKKCPYCDLFFIAKDNKRKRCYTESCSREYEKQRKRKQRQDEPEFYV